MGVRTKSGGVRTWPAGSFTTDEVLARKGARLVSVVIPAKNEVLTVAGVIEPLRTAHGRRTGSGLLDEVLVVDDGSTDRTAAVARRAGATVHRLPRSGGKGRAMLAGAEVASGDVVVFLDADVLDTDPGWIPQLLGPLFADPHVELVKGYYDRPIDGRPTGGGRVTELAARPMLSLLYPDLAGVLQPLAGETAARRTTILDVGIEPDYGAEVGLLIDVARRGGPRAIAQVDLGTRTHRNRPLAELSSIARDVLRVALSRAGVPTAPAA
jgi:glucosyl-3-phosphoglycerate synthase